MADFVPDLRGVTAEEVQRRRKLFAERLAGCPLEQWLERRRPVNIGASTGNSRSFCSCRCHAARPLHGAVGERRKAA